MLSQQLSRTERELRQQIGHIAAAHELSISEALLLLECVRDPHGHNSQRQLADFFGCSAAQISGQLDALRVRGLLIAQRPAHDRRRQSWRATQCGQQMADSMGRRLAAITSPLVTADFIERLIGCLSTLRQVIAGCGRGGDHHDGEKGRQHVGQTPSEHVQFMREKAA